MSELVKKEWIKRLIYSGFALVLSAYCGRYMYLNIERSNYLIAGVGLIWLITIFAFFFPDKASKLGKKIIKYRWILAGVIFLVCIIFRIHGSSMEKYNWDFPEQSDANAAREYHIIGKCRPIRSDEWMVQTPLFFSQESNDYKLESKQMSVSGLNMVLCYYAPVKDITIIGKPFAWGYLIGGNALGLSWYWCSMMILLFMTAFEMFMIISHRNAKLSLVGMMMIGLSPVMQWWFVPHIPVVFIYAMGLFSIGYHFFTAKTRVLKWTMSVLAGIAVVGFALSIFPSCQVIAALCMAGLFAVCLYRDREEITFTLKQWPRLALPIAFAGGVLIYFLVKSADGLELLTSTVYPGKRISLGGGSTLADLFTNLSSAFMPYKDVIKGNNSESAKYIHFAPLFIVLFPYMYVKLRKYKDKDVVVGGALWTMLLIQIIFMCVGFTEMISKITFFSYVNRMQLSYGWIGVIFTIWSVYVIWKHEDMFRLWEKILYPLIYGAVYYTFIDRDLIDYIGKASLVKEIMVFIAILLFVFFVKKHMFGYLMVAFMCFAGLLVNPVNRGISPVINHPISNCIADEVKKNPDGIWLSVDTYIGYMGNFVMANGARVMDGTNFYPDFEKWEILDPEGKYEHCYNRYSNQTFKLTNEDTVIGLKSADHLVCSINPKDVVKLGVNYLVSQRDVTEDFRKYDIDSEIIFDRGGYYIFKLEY